MDGVFRALADPTRRRILKALNERDMAAGELTKLFPISAPSMSHHFAVLKSAGLVETRRQGQQIVYSLNTTAFQDMVSTLMDIFTSKESDGEEK
jgi:DNA-binding transcriptional ArsR family regulator